jgi:short-subunit dehydrogenase
MSEPLVAVVTGATAGVGRALARMLGSRQAKIGLIARNAATLGTASEEVVRLGGQALPLPTDVSDADAVERSAAAIEEKFGPIDLWINNAMVSVFSPIKQMTADEFKRVTEVTYLGYIYGTLSALRRMLPRDRGTIVQVGSALAYRGIPLQAAYCGAKHAVQGFTESLRCELLHDHSQVRVTMVQLPAINTPQFSWVKSRLPRKPQPVPPIFQPEVAAEAILYAAEHYRPEWNLGWPTVKAILAAKLMPGVADVYLARTGYESQQYYGAADPNRRNNLWGPVPDDFGAHGDFDARARNRSWQFWITKNRNWLALAGVGVACVASGLLCGGAKDS